MSPKSQDSSETKDWFRTVQLSPLRIPSGGTGWLSTSADMGHPNRGDCWVIISSMNADFNNTNYPELTIRLLVMKQFHSCPRSGSVALNNSQLPFQTLLWSLICGTKDWTGQNRHTATFQDLSSAWTWRFTIGWLLLVSVSNWSGGKRPSGVRFHAIQVLSVWSSGGLLCSDCGGNTSLSHV